MVMVYGKPKNRVRMVMFMPVVGVSEWKAMR